MPGGSQRSLLLNSYSAIFREERPIQQRRVSNGWNAFVKATLSHAVNTYSATGFVAAIVLFVVSLVPTVDSWVSTASRPISGALLLVSLLWSSYLAWKDVVDRLPPLVDLSILPDRTSINAPVNGGRLPKKGHLDLGFDVSNPAENPVDLEEIICYKWSGGPLAIDGSLKLMGQRGPGGFGEIQLPFRVESQERRKDDLRVYAALVPPSDEREFARALVAREEISITLEFRFQSPARDGGSKIVEFVIPMADYRMQVLNRWRDSGNSDLIAMAGDIDRYMS